MTMYSHEFKESLEKKLSKLAKKSPLLVKVVGKKVKEVTSGDNASHYKNLRSPLQHLKRVHIDGGRFVLVFSVDEEEKHIIFENFKHHDDIYKDV